MTKNMKFIDHDEHFANKAIMLGKTLIFQDENSILLNDKYKRL